MSPEYEQALAYAKAHCKEPSELPDEVRYELLYGDMPKAEHVVGPGTRDTLLYDSAAIIRAIRTNQSLDGVLVLPVCQELCDIARFNAVNAERAIHGDCDIWGIHVWMLEFVKDFKALIERSPRLTAQPLVGEVIDVYEACATYSLSFTDAYLLTRTEHLVATSNERLQSLLVPARYINALMSCWENTFPSDKPYIGTARRILNINGIQDEREFLRRMPDLVLQCHTFESEV